jgi:hypothetical protein
MSPEKTDFNFFAACAPRTALAKCRRRRRLLACIAPAGAYLRGFFDKLTPWKRFHGVFFIFFDPPGILLPAQPFMG